MLRRRVRSSVERDLLGRTTDAGGRSDESLRLSGDELRDEVAESAEEVVLRRLELARLRDALLDAAVGASVPPVAPADMRLLLEYGQRDATGRHALARERGVSGPALRKRIERTRRRILGE
jgi:hypothetical protein